MVETFGSCYVLHPLINHILSTQVDITNIIIQLYLSLK